MKEKDEEKIPLKTILTNFLNHVETLEAKREEGEDLYEKEFQVRLHSRRVYKLRSSWSIHAWL